MEFVWHDGGRAACGYVGITGDCVTRSIAIATGEVYRDVYQSLSRSSDKTARHGVSAPIYEQFLAERGWKVTEDAYLHAGRLPKGAVLVDFVPVESRKRSGHLSCLIDHIVYDTWNPFEDREFRIAAYWTLAPAADGKTSSVRAPGSRPSTNESRLTQREYEKILQRVQALHRTASNHASTEGEIRNALRAMQSLMLEHNLDRDDIVDDDVSRVGMTRRACPLNGTKACQWESSLAHYLTDEIFPTVQYFRDRQGHRTFFWFYGPVDDVEQTLGLFREMLITIATAAHVKYGGHTRGSGASYAEGYVRGLPRRDQHKPQEQTPMSEGALIHNRALAIHSAADKWLNVECGIRLQSYRSSGRYNFDASAHHAGKRDGAKHEHSGQRSRRQITHNRGSG